MKWRKQRFALEKLRSNNFLIDCSWRTVAAPFTSSQCAAMLRVLLVGGECRRASCCCSIPLHYLIHSLPNPFSVVASLMSHNTVKTKDLPAHQPPPPTSLTPLPFQRRPNAPTTVWIYYTLEKRRPLLSLLSCLLTPLYKTVDLAQWRVGEGRGQGSETDCNPLFTQPLEPLRRRHALFSSPKGRLADST